MQLEVFCKSQHVIRQKGFEMPGAGKITRHIYYFYFVIERFEMRECSYLSYHATQQQKMKKPEDKRWTNQRVQTLEAGNLITVE